MRFPVRMLGVLLVLLAFSASVAEGVWASTCAAMEMGAAGEGEMTMPMDGMGSEHSAPLPEPDRAPGDERDCPLPALAGPGCIVVSLPAPTPRLDAIPADRSDALLARPELSDRLAVSDLFHPPQP